MIRLLEIERRSAVPADYHLHGLGHEGPPHNVERLLPFARAAHRAGLTEIGFAEHDFYLADLDFDVFARLEQCGQIKVRVGLEVDFSPDNQHWQELDGRPWDYLIGSVHAIGDWAFDYPGEEGGFASRDIDTIYADYFALVGRAAATGLFQIIGHLDLIKIYGHRPRQPVVELAEPALQLIAASGAVLELNTAGLFKPVAEIYPSPELLARAFELNIPVTISSDAHAPEEVGRQRAQAVEILRRIGYNCLATFCRRQMFTEPLA